jgi:hypothetical protein
MNRTGLWSCPMAGLGVNDIKLLDSATTVFSFSYKEQTIFQGHYLLHYMVTKHIVYIQINNMMQFMTVCVMQEYGSLVAEKNRTRG